MPRHFPDWLKAYTKFTMGSEAPLDFHFWTGVSTIAACLRRQVWRDELYFKWTPNFYIIFVGPAGVVTKSTTLNLGFRLLEKVPGVFKGPDSMTWHGLGKDFEAAFEYKTYKDDKGVEKKIGQSALTCSISELGTFLRPDDKALVSFLTDIWDGRERPFRHKTQDSVGIEVNNPWLNIIAATTPEWMQNNFPVSFLSEGIGARIIFVHADVKRHFVAYPSRRIVVKDFNEVEAKLIEDLIEITKLIGPFNLTEAAFDWGEKWYDTHLRSRSTAMASGRFSSYLARKQTHMHKLAMVLVVSQGDKLEIDVKHLEEAEIILNGTEQSMLKVFEGVGAVDEARHLGELIPYVRAHKWITAPDLYKLVYNIMSKRDYEMALKGGIEGGLFDVVTRNGTRGVSLHQKLH